MLRFKRDKNDTAGMPFAITKDGDYKRAGLDDLEGALFEHICANRYRIASGKWEGWVIDNVQPAWIGDFGPSDYPAAVPDLIASAKPTSKYHRPCKGVEIDVYDVLRAFKVTNPAIAHAVKKCLAPGQRGAKSWAQDVEEAIKSLQRALEMGE